MLSGIPPEMTKFNPASSLRTVDSMESLTGVMRIRPVKPDTKPVPNDPMRPYDLSVGFKAKAYRMEPNTEVSCRCPLL